MTTYLDISFGHIRDDTGYHKSTQVNMHLRPSLGPLKTFMRCVANAKQQLVTKYMLKGNLILHENNMWLPRGMFVPDK